MAKKKDKQTTVYNIDSVNMEIDYDKLAEAITKAQRVAGNDEKTTGKVRSVVIKFFNGIVYVAVCVLSVLAIYSVWTEVVYTPDTSLVNCIVLTIVLAIVAIFAFLCQQESFDDKEKDALDYFNANVSLLALVIAMLALFEEIA